MSKYTSRRSNQLSAFAKYGNKTSYTLNRRKSPFSRIKQIYGDTLERFEMENSEPDFQTIELKNAHIKEIKERVLAQYKKEKLQNYIIFTSIIVATILLILFVNYYLLGLIKTYWP